MAKVPYLFRRNNIFYFRTRIPLKHQKSFKAKEVVLSLKTENQAEAVPLALIIAARFKTSLLGMQTSKTDRLSYTELVSSLNVDPTNNNPQNNAVTPLPVVFVNEPSSTLSTSQKAPLLSVVITDFLDRYDRNNKATLTKLNAVLPIFLELIGDKSINQILQTDINAYFDEVQKLPVRRDAKIFRCLSIKQIILINSGKCISEGTFKNTYRACLSIFINWAVINYKDQGFPSLSTQGAVYCQSALKSYHL